MINQLLQIDVLLKILANTLLVSIPEETFIVLFTLSLLGVFDYLSYENVAETNARLKKSDIIKASVAILVPAIMSNIMRYTGVEFLSSYVIFFVVIFGLILGIYGLWRNIREVAKVLLFVLFAGLIILIVESAYIPFILYSMEITIGELNSSILYNFLITLPERILEGLIIILLLTKKCTFLKAKLIQTIMESSFLLSSTIFLTLFNIGYMVFQCKVIGYDKILIKLPYLIQVTGIVGSFLVPLLNISGLLWCIYQKENQIRQRHEESLGLVEQYVKNVKALYTANDGSVKIKVIIEKLEQIEVELKGLRGIRRRGV